MKTKWKKTTHESDNHSKIWIVDELGKTICYLVRYGFGLEWTKKQEANARLIAAAPELLEAAKFAIQICQGSMDPAATDCSLKLKEAIKKATQP